MLIFKWNWLSEEPNGDASVYALSFRDSEKVALRLADRLAFQWQENRTACGPLTR